MRRAMVLVATGLLALAAPTLARQHEQSPANVESRHAGDSERRFDLATARGSMLGVHLLVGQNAARCAGAIAANEAAAPTLAGVRHVYLVRATPEEFQSVLAAVPKDAAKSMYRDGDGVLAATLAAAASKTGSTASPASAPDFVLHDAAGDIVWRHSRSTSGHVAFKDIAAKVGELTRDRETTEGNFEKGLALQGYDPVGYIDEGRARRGDAKCESMFRGATYRFASAESRARFNAEPGKYLPAYGGWCATAMAEGDKVKIDPENFKVTDGRLFLFYKGLLGNAIKDWNKDEKRLTERADAAWGTLKGEKPPG